MPPRRVAVFLVECFWPGLAIEGAVAAAERVQVAVLGARRRGRDVMLVDTIFIVTDETVFCLFQGCEEDVRAVAVEAHLPFERILSSVQIEP